MIKHKHFLRTRKIQDCPTSLSLRTLVRRRL